MIPLTAHLLPDVFQWLGTMPVLRFSSFTSYKNDSPRSVHSTNKTVFPPAALLTDKHGARRNMLHKAYRVSQGLTQLECRNLNLLSEMQTNEWYRLVYFCVPTLLATYKSYNKAIRQPQYLKYRRQYSHSKTFCYVIPGEECVWQILR